MRVVVEVYSEHIHDALSSVFVGGAVDVQPVEYAVPKVGVMRKVDFRVNEKPYSVALTNYVNFVLSR